jgi:exosortase
LAQRHWSTEAGAQGPLILATGVWLIWRQRHLLHLDPGRSHALWPTLLIPFVLLYAFGRGYSMLTLETASLYLIFVVAGLTYLGADIMRRLWFPVLYLSFLIVPSGSLVTEVTQPLKIWVSRCAVNLLYLAGYPVAHSGAVIQIGEHQLLVATACAGLASLFSLTAVGLFYVHLQWNSNLVRSLALLLAIVPIAILCNVARVLTLVVVTYRFGSGPAQGFIHEGAGIFMFAVAMAGMFAADWMLGLALPAGDEE